MDEAISALNPTSEAVVQAAIEKASRGRTTVTVAHRLSTVKSADKIIQAAFDEAAKERTTGAITHRLSAAQNVDLICVLEDGRVVECGTHAELIRKRGRYFAMPSLQVLGM